MTISAVVLAADAGEGFTTPKYLTPIDGRPMVRSVVESALTWPVDEVIVVVGSDADEVVSSFDDLDVTTVIDPEWDEGIAAPIRAALDVVSRERTVSRVVMAYGDQPRIPDGLVEKLLGVAEQHGADLVVPKYRYQRGWPIVVGEALWRRLLGMEDAFDLDGYLSMHAAAIHEEWFDQLPPHRYRTADDLA